MSGESEKRRSERLPGRFRVEVREKLATWSTFTEDVSARGCRIGMKRPLTPGMLVQLAFDMGEGQEPLVVHAQVAWVRRTPVESAGFAFLSTPREVRRPQPGYWIDRLLGSSVRGGRDAPKAATAPRPAIAPRTGAATRTGTATRTGAATRTGSSDAIILPPVA